jgi:hypothetical protein
MFHYAVKNIYDTAVISHTQKIQLFLLLTQDTD